jgi:hypothetical protein
MEVRTIWRNPSKKRLFHSCNPQGAEYNDVWSRKCGRDPNPKEERTVYPYVEADESAYNAHPAE